MNNSEPHTQQVNHSLNEYTQLITEKNDEKFEDAHGLIVCITIRNWVRILGHREMNFK